VPGPVELDLASSSACNRAARAASLSTVSLTLGPDASGPEAGSPLYGLFDEKRLAFFLPESSASATADGLPGPDSSYEGGGAPV
jgi:hypothetical protein